MTVISTFLVNLLCSIVSCEVPHEIPEIRGTFTDPGGGLFSKNFIQGDEIPPSPIVQTKYGDLEGYVMRTAGNRRIFAFEGIPYAEPPVGPRWRFRAAGPLRPWNGLRDAKKPGNKCLQFNLPRQLRVLGSDDCLYANVYTPRIPGNEPTNFGKKVDRGLPVVVNIHGGSFYFGFGHELGPSYLLDKDVILVTFNYRLGVLGFLSTGDNSAPGNYGLKDQSLLINFVAENIHVFGGDSSRITLLGQSSGGASAHLHALSPLSSPNFSGGVSLSGSAFTYWAVKSKKQSQRLSTSLAKMLHCPTTQGNEIMVECLRSKNPVDLVAAQYKLMEFAPFPITLFSPVVETEGTDEQPFLTQYPHQHYALGNVDRKPWVFSMAAQEGYLALLLLQSLVVEGTLRSRWNELAPIFMDYKHTATNVSAVTEQLTKFYFGPKRSPRNADESKIAAMWGDRMFLSGVNKAIELHSQHAPTYAYIFGFRGKYTLGSMVGRKSDDWGVGHAEDLFHFFNGSFYLPGFKASDKEELRMSDLMTGFLANFAATGNPNSFSKFGSVSQATIWEPSFSNSINFLQLNNKEIKMIPQPFKKRLKFWNKQIAPFLLQDENG